MCYILVNKAGCRNNFRSVLLRLPEQSYEKMNGGVLPMIIGIPKEIMHEEDRVAATPDTVKAYVALGADVLVEKMPASAHISPMNNMLQQVQK